MARSGTINMRRWPRSAVQLRPTVIDIPGTPVGVLTTGAAYSPTAVLHNATTLVLTTAAADARAAAGKTMTFSVLTTAAAYNDVSGVQAVVHNISVLTTGAATAGISSPGLGYLLDENGFPILDEAGFPILISVDSFWKNSDQTTTVTGAVFVRSGTIPATNIATAVLTAFGGTTATVIAHESSASVRVDGAADTRANVSGQRVAPTSTTAAAHTQSPTLRTTPISAQTTGAAVVGADVAHSTPTASQVAVAAYSGAAVGHEVSVAVRTTAAVYTFALLPAFNGISVAVSTSAAADTRSATAKASTVAAYTAGAGNPSSPVGHDATAAVSTTAAGDSTAGVTHNPDPLRVKTFAAADSFTSAGKDGVTVASVTFAAMSAQALVLHDAFVDALTTGASHSQWSEILIQLCVEVFASADRVEMSCDADAVVIEVEEC